MHEKLMPTVIVNDVLREAPSFSYDNLDNLESTINEVFSRRFEDIKRRATLREGLGWQNNKITLAAKDYGKYVKTILGVLGITPESSRRIALSFHYDSATEGNFTLSTEPNSFAHNLRVDISLLSRGLPRRLLEVRYFPNETGLQKSKYEEVLRMESKLHGLNRFKKLELLDELMQVIESKPETANPTE